jgi:predicted dehydrogenase
LSGAKIGFGIVGLGAIAGLHAEALGQIEGAELRAVCDNDPRRAQAFADRHGGRPCGDIGDFLRDDGVEAVLVTTPSGLHEAVAVAAMKAGRHVIVEKPLEITEERCERMIAAAKENGVLLSGVFQNRFFEASRRTREAVEKGRFGKIVMCNAYVKWYRSQEYYDGGVWRGTMEIDGGGALMNQSVHALDLLLWFGGKVREVSARSATLAHERIEVEDVLVSTVLFENGAMGTVEATTAVHSGFPKRMEILGTGGCVILEEENITEWRFAEERKEDDEIRARFKSLSGASGASDPMGISSEGHRLQFEDCIKALETGKPPLVDGTEAAKAVALVRAMYKSAEDGKPVVLS